MSFFRAKDLVLFCLVWFALVKVHNSIYNISFLSSLFLPLLMSKTSLFSLVGGIFSS